NPCSGNHLGPHRLAPEATDMNIDAVITWVDGADPAHRQRLDAYLTGIGQSRPPSAERTRFNDA
ncbi:MAG: Stealth CR1 domain-containing protein, partial [Xanthomonadales bacterium]|nr:Stealth CR1 domain-containing protein [Xanthomonadales bacterium]